MTDGSNEAAGGEAPRELLPGTLDLLVLEALSHGDMHGWGLAQRIEKMSDGALAISQGSLYPALQRLKRKRCVRSEWQNTENNRRARYYRLTPDVAEQLGRERESWQWAFRAVNRVLAWEEGV